MAKFRFESVDLVGRSTMAEDMIDGLPKSLLIKDAIYGLGFEVRQMRDTPAGKLDLPKALKRIEDELGRIGRGEVSAGLANQAALRVIEDARIYADRLDNPDFHIGFADRGHVAYLLRKLVDRLN